MILYFAGLSLVITAVLIVRALFRKKASPMLVYGLWLAAALRLVIPISLVGVEMSMPSLYEKDHGGDVVLNEPAAEGSTDVTFPYAGGVSSVTVETSETVIELPPEKLPEIYGSELPELSEPEIMVPETEAEYEIPQMPPAAAPAVKKFEMPSVGTILRVVWISGSVIAGIFFTVSGIAFSVKLRKGRELFRIIKGRFFDTKVYVSEAVASPCLAGIIPTVYITKKAAESSMLPLVLSHEYTHMLHGDHLWSLLRTLAVIVHWWNPLVWSAAILSKQDAELACDYAVASRLDEKFIRRYAHMIVEMLPRKKQHLTGFGGGQIKERIVKLGESGGYRSTAAVIAAVMVVFAAGCSFIRPEEPHGGGEVTAITFSSNSGSEKKVNDGDVLVPPDKEYPKIISNKGNIEFSSVYIPVYSGRPNLSGGHYYDEDHVIFITDDGYESDLYNSFQKNLGMTMYLVDIKNGRLADEYYMGDGRYPTTINYKKDGVEMLFFWFDTENMKNVIECGYGVSCKDGKLSVNEKDIDAVYPLYERPIYSPDGRYTVYTVIDDGNGHGALVLRDSSGVEKRLFERVMLYDDLGGGEKAGLGDVEGYSIVEFIDNDSFVYNIGGWEWTKGYGIYNIDSGTYKEFRNGYGIMGCAEGELYASLPGSDGYGVAAVYRMEPDGKQKLVANYGDADGDEYILGDNQSIRLVDDMWQIAEYSEEKYNIKLYSIDFKNLLAEYEYLHNKTVQNSYIKDGRVVFVNTVTKAHGDDAGDNGENLRVIYTDVNGDSVKDRAEISTVGKGENILYEHIYITDGKAAKEIEVESAIAYVYDNVNRDRYTDEKYRLIIGENRYYVDKSSLSTPTEELYDHLGLGNKRKFGFDENGELVCYISVSVSADEICGELVVKYEYADGILRPASIEYIGGDESFDENDIDRILREYHAGKISDAEFVTFAGVREMLSGLVNQILAAYSKGKDPSVYMPSPRIGVSYLDMMPDDAEYDEVITADRIGAMNVRLGFDTLSGAENVVAVDIGADRKLKLYWDVGGFGESVDMYISDIELFDPADTVLPGKELFVHKVFASRTLLLFCSDDSKLGFTVYRTDDYGTSFKNAKVVLQGDVKYDSLLPIWSGGGGGSGEVRFIVKAVKDGKESYLSFDNFRYTDSSDWAVFVSSGESVEEWISDESALVADAYDAVMSYDEGISRADAKVVVFKNELEAQVSFPLDSPGKYISVSYAKENAYECWKRIEAGAVNFIDHER